MCIQNGYGFVHFPLTSEGIDSALQAVESLHQVTINNVSYDCSVSNQLRQVLFNTGRLLKKSQHGMSQPNLSVNTSQQSTSPRFHMTPTNNQPRISGMDQVASVTPSDAPVNSMMALQQLQQQAILQGQTQQMQLRQAASWSEAQFSAETPVLRSKKPSPLQGNQNFQAPTNTNAYVMNGMIPKPPTAPVSHVSYQMHPQSMRNGPDVPVSPVMSSNIPVFFAKDRDTASYNSSAASSRSRSFYAQGTDGSGMDDIATTVGALSLSTSMDYWGEGKSIANSSHSSMSSFLPGASFYLGEPNSHNASFSDGSVGGSHNSSTSNLNSNILNNNMRNVSALAAMSGSAMGIAHPSAQNVNRTNMVPGISMYFHQTPPLPHQQVQQVPQQNATLQPLQRPVPFVSVENKMVSPLAASPLQQQQYQQSIHAHLPPPTPKYWFENNNVSSMNSSHVASNGLDGNLYPVVDVVGSGGNVGHGLPSMHVPFPSNNVSASQNTPLSSLSSLNQGTSNPSQGPSLDELITLPSEGLLSTLSSPRAFESKHSSEQMQRNSLLQANALMNNTSLEETPAWH